MEMSASKRRILDEALRLFSINGYEATSIDDITDSVGIRKASFYSHFKSKQELLDTLVDEIVEKYKTYSEVSQKNLFLCNNDDMNSVQLTADDIFESFKQQFEFLIYDPFFCMARNFLTIEQFRNPRLAAIQNQCEYIDALDYYKKLIQHLVDNNILINSNVELMSHELFSPMYVQFYHIQKDPECREEALKIIKNHIYHFFTIYSK